jgi:hypothetical protein
MPAPASAQRAWRALLLTVLSALPLGAVISGSQSSRALAGSAAAIESQPAGEALPHCLHQKALFGLEAAQRLPYVECEKDDEGRRRCAAASIRAFPTWDLLGERREGMLSLEELRIWSGFQPSASGATAKPAKP